MNPVESFIARRYILLGIGMGAIATGHPNFAIFFAVAFGAAAIYDHFRKRNGS